LEAVKDKTNEASMVKTEGERIKERV